ncbi:MAG: RNA polymerase sigma-70 factor [Tannerellaceae bacterium]|nr:RNA polymerase sigma-70 factor [Tannerellaceae bacterium]
MKAMLPTFDKEDYSKIYAVYFPKLVRFSQTYVMSPCDAENSVQDIFLYLWEHQDVLGSLGNINAFLFTLVKNRCIDFLRNHSGINGKRQPLSVVHERELELKLYSLQQFDEKNLSSVEIETIITNAIQSLPERCREIFVLSRLEGLRHKDIAARLNISTNTIEGQIGIALKKLRAALKDYIPIFIFII